MSDPTMPGTFTVLVGDDPVRRVATRRRSRWDVWTGADGWWSHFDSQVHDAVEVIPDGTPVDRIVVLPEVAEALRDPNRRWRVGLSAPLPGDMTRRRAYERVDESLLSTARDLAIAHAIDAEEAAARAAEPTPDPLAQAREELLAASDRYRALLAATEGGAS